MAAAKTSALDLFNSLTAAEVKAQIAEIDGAIAVLEKKRDSLRSIEKAIDIRDNGKPKRGWSEKRKAKAAAKAAGNGAAQTDDDPDDSDGEVTGRATTEALAPVRTATSGRTPSPETIELRNRLYQHIRIHGPMSVSELSRSLKVEYGKVQNAIDSAQFRKLPDGKWTIK